jgi:muramoyltetrapeptide carboxypeptidase LdcA involved in peptidoglycan recycling
MTSPPLKKPRALAPGSRVAIVAPSWGGPATLTHRYEMGLRELRERFSFEVVEMPHTRSDADWIWRNPKARADDLNTAFADTSIEGIITAIGGFDSVRTLPYLDAATLANNPKVFLGFSDTTAIHIYALIHGLQTFYGPSVMAGIAENCGTLPYTESWIRRTIMSAEPLGELEASTEWTEEHIPWEKPELSGTRRTLHPNPGWQWLQGSKRAEGRLIGGCLDVFEVLKGTQWWPAPHIWEGAVFYWETSEEVPDPLRVGWWLRNYGMMGTFDKISAMLVGRPSHFSPYNYEELRKTIKRIVADEFGRPDLPIVTDMDFGHTDPQMVLPNGGRIIVDPTTQTIALPEPATQN